MRPESSRWIWSPNQGPESAQRPIGPRVERLEHRQVRVRENGEIDRESDPQALFDRSRPTARLVVSELRRESTLDVEFSKLMCARARQPDYYRLVRLESPGPAANEESDAEEREIPLERVEPGPLSSRRGFRVRLYYQEPLAVGSYRLEIFGTELTDEDGGPAIGQTLTLPFEIRPESERSGSSGPGSPSDEPQPPAAALRLERVVRPRAALASLEIAFSRAMGLAAILPSSYALIDESDGRRIGVTAVARGGECDCRLLLAEPLRDGRYRLSLDPGLADRDGVRLQGRMNWRFWVVGAPSSEPPRAVWDLPDRIETPIREIELAFSQPMGRSAFAVESYELMREDGRRIPLVGAARIDSARTRLASAIPLIRGRFRLRIIGEAADVEGQALAGDREFRFEVVADRLAPRIAIDWPDRPRSSPSQAEAIAVRGPIAEIPLRFNRPMGDSAFSVDHYKLLRLGSGEGGAEGQDGEAAEEGGPILIASAARIGDEGDRAELRFLEPLGPGRYELSVSSWIVSGEGVPIANPGPIAIQAEDGGDHDQDHDHDSEASAAAEFADGDWVSALDVTYSDGMTARAFLRSSHQLRDAEGRRIPIAAIERVDSNQARLWIVPALEGGREMELRIADSLTNLAGASLEDNAPIVCAIPSPTFNSESEFVESSPTDPYAPSAALGTAARSVSTEEWKAALESVMKSAMQSAQVREVRQSLRALSDEEKARAVDEAMLDLSIASFAALSDRRGVEPSLPEFDDEDEDEDDESRDEIKAFPSVGGLMTSSFSSFEVTFSDPMSESAFDPLNYAIQTREGLPVYLLDAERLDSKSVKLRLAERLGNGRYRLFIRPEATDVRGVSIGEPRSFEFEIDERTAGTIHWIRPGDGDWGDPANWSEERIPGPDDDVRIDGDRAGGVRLTVTVARIQASARSLSVAEGLIIRDGSLTVRGPSECNRLTVSGRGELRVEGPDAAFVVRGRTSVQGGSLAAIDGAWLSLPTASTIESSAHPGAALLAEGANSVLDLSGVPRIQGVFPLRIAAKDGGFIDLQNTRELIQSPIPGRRSVAGPGASASAGVGVRAIAEGPGSRIDLASLRVFRDRSSTRSSRLEAKFGGIIHLDAMSRSLSDFDPILRAEGEVAAGAESESGSDEAELRLTTLAEETARRSRLRIGSADPDELPRLSSSSASRRKIGRIPIGKSS